MNYYLRKMKGSLVRLRLLAIPNNEKLSFDEDVEDKKEWVIAHCWGYPSCPMTRSMMPKVTDFSSKWCLGPEQTSDGHMMGGHHIGEILKEITKSEALNYMRLATLRSL